MTVPRTDVLRVLTLNIWGGGGDWSRRRKDLRDQISRTSPDVVTLQEALLGEADDQVAEILGDGWFVAHQRARGPDGSGVATASRYPIEDSFEIDLHVSERTHDFACTSLVCALAAPGPWGRVWVVNHFPDYQPDHELERERQAARAARCVEGLLVHRPGHVLVAGDFDADPDAASLRFWTGRQSLEAMSVCYRDTWESAAGRRRAGESGDTFVPENPYSADWDWPFRRIDHILVRCGTHGGPTLEVLGCQRVFDRADDVASDHYGLVAELGVPRPPEP
jgi:endonuclease/exonuclease/phosphatase family metal-dependent hydrolase